MSTRTAWESLLALFEPLQKGDDLFVRKPLLPAPSLSQSGAAMTRSELSGGEPSKFREDGQSPARLARPRLIDFPPIKHHIQGYFVGYQRLSFSQSIGDWWSRIYWQSSC